MKKELWDDELLESLLKQAPKMTDHRTKEDVFKRLQDEGAFNELPPQKSVVASKGIRWAPLLASIASLFIVVVIAQQLINNSSNDSSGNEENSVMMSDAKTEATEEMAKSANRSLEMDQSAESSLMAADFAQQTLVYESQLQGMTLFTIGFAGDDAESVPVSFLIPNDVVESKLGTTEPTKMQLYETFAPLIDEQSLGFNEYHPLKGKLYVKDGKLTHQLPQDHSYDAGSAALSNYIGVLVDTFGDAYDEVFLENEQGETLYLEAIGEINEPITVTGPSTQYNYFVYQKHDGTKYLSPNFRMSYSSVEEALKNMTIEANDVYQTAILPDVTYQVETKNNEVIVSFDEVLELEKYDSVEAMRMIEAIVLTAASFDQQVQFEQIQPQQWGGFDFTKPLEKPVAANQIYYEF